MLPASRFLFPNLPPELRNEVYNYLSTPGINSSASLIGLPLKLKTYEDKHTTVQICPVHYGSIGLLALQTYQFEEGREYTSWLLNNAIELKIGITFKGRLSTFVQQHWDQKMEAHLRKLARLHPWLKKVAKYDIQILWNPVDSILKGKKNKRVAGQIPRDMVTIMTALTTNDDVKTKHGDLSVKLRLQHDTAAEIYFSKSRFGFSEFLSSTARTHQAFRTQTKEVWMEIETHTNKPASTKTTSPFLPLPPAAPQHQDLLVVAQKRCVRWTCCPTAKIVVGKYLLDGVETKRIVGAAKDRDSVLDCVVASLVRECRGWGYV